MSLMLNTARHDQDKGNVWKQVFEEFVVTSTAATK